MATDTRQTVDTPSVLTLDTTTNVTRFRINNKIPIQTIILESIRVEYDTAPHALAAGVIYVDLPFLSSYQLNDGTQFFNLPIFLDNAVVTLEQVRVPIYLTKNIPEDFTMSVRDSAGALLAGGFARISLQFSYSKTDNN